MRPKVKGMRVMIWVHGEMNLLEEREARETVEVKRLKMQRLQEAEARRGGGLSGKEYKKPLKDGG